jgi:hypothetical protein
VDGDRELKMLRQIITRRHAIDQNRQGQKKGEQANSRQRKQIGLASRKCVFYVQGEAHF